jgi:dTDP-4-amino-4,6-dideoxygalactose transaminase
MDLNIPFNKPFVTGKEMAYLEQAAANGHLSGAGPFAERCQHWLSDRLGCPAALLTTSGTAALEMASILLNISPGDEIIMPSFSFVSTANASVLRGGVPVFINIRPDTLNMDETLIEGAVTKKTKAVVPVHYAGVCCEMETIMDIAAHANVAVVEDAAHAILSTYRGRPAGTIGCLAALSFHETKNLHCGEGGAILINRPEFTERAEILLHKGTDRRQFDCAQVAKYQWVDVGSSFLSSEINAAFLCAQLESADAIQERRLSLWQRYHVAFAGLEDAGRVRRPSIPPDREHNAHLYYLLLPDEPRRDRVMTSLPARGIQAIFHYILLHSSKGGLRFSRCSGSLDNTVTASSRIVRLPLWLGMEGSINRIIDEVMQAVHAL